MLTGLFFLLTILVVMLPGIFIDKIPVGDFHRDLTEAALCLVFVSTNLFFYIKQTSGAKRAWIVTLMSSILVGSLVTLVIYYFRLLGIFVWFILLVMAWLGDRKNQK